MGNKTTPIVLMRVPEKEHDRVPSYQRGVVRFCRVSIRLFFRGDWGTIGICSVILAFDHEKPETSRVLIVR